MPRIRIHSGTARGCLIGIFAFVIGAFALGGFGARFLYKAAAPLIKPNGLNEALSKVTGGLVPEMRAVAGDASRFDPIASYGAAKEFAGPGAKLTGMNVRFVRQDGTLDLKAAYSPSPGVDYSFVREVPRPANAPPPGAGGGTGPWFEPVKIAVLEPGRTISRSVNGSRATFPNRGMIRYPDTATPKPDAAIADPTCSMAALWKLATAGRDVPADAVAVVRYDEDGYRFAIADLKINAAFGPDCRKKR